MFEGTPNIASEIMFHRREYETELEKYRDRLRCIAMIESSRISKRLRHLDKDGDGVRAVLDGMPSSLLMELIRAGPGWEYEYAVVDVLSDDAVLDEMERQVEQLRIRSAHWSKKPKRDM